MKMLNRLLSVLVCFESFKGKNHVLLQDGMQVVK